MSESNKIGESRKAWQEGRYAREIQKKKERKPAFETTSRIPVNPVYTPADLQDGRYLDDLGFPG